MFCFTIETLQDTHPLWILCSCLIHLNIQFHHQLEVEQIVIKFYINASSWFSCCIKTDRIVNVVRWMTALSFFPLSNIKIIISDKMEMFRARARCLHWHKNWKQLFPSLTFLVTWNILQKNRNNNNCRHGWVLVKTRHLLLLQPPLIDFYLTDGSWTKHTHHTLCNL